MATTAASNGFQKGDWIVHRFHGVGQIRGVEKKKLAGESSRFYRVKTKESTMWIPVNTLDEENIRPLATPQQFGKVLKVFERPAKEMHDDHNQRKKRINEVKKHGSLLAVARLIRDLAARRRENRLNDTEDRSMRWFINRLVREWSICKQIEEAEAERELQTLIFEEVQSEA